MMQSTRHLFATAVAAIALSLCGSASAVSVTAAGSGATGILTDLGQFDAGDYLIVGSGTADFLGAGDGIARPDGLPAIPVTNPQYLYFNVAGSYNAAGQFGPAGPNARLGALIGTLSATPRSPADWFLIGNLASVRLDTAGHIYASVNDHYYDNNVGAFNVTVQAVPEPSEYMMLAAGLMLFAAFSRYRRNTREASFAIVQPLRLNKRQGAGRGRAAG